MSGPPGPPAELVAEAGRRLKERLRRQRRLTQRFSPSRASKFGVDPEGPRYHVIVRSNRFKTSMIACGVRGRGAEYTCAPDRRL